jgi:hypothetical protein
MMNRWMTGWQTAFLGIALGLGVTSTSATGRAQDGGLEGDCTRNTHPCAERCPAYDTCYISDDQQIYYSVMGRRFDCNGLDCGTAGVTLENYCCERGEFAPSAGDDDGGGCGLIRAVPEAPEAGGVASGVWLGGLVMAGIGWRRARLRRRRSAPRDNLRRGDGCGGQS